MSEKYEGETSARAYIAELEAELEKTKALLDLAVLLLPKDVQVTYSLTTSVEDGTERSAP